MKKSILSIVFIIQANLIFGQWVGIDLPGGKAGSVVVVENTIITNAQDGLIYRTENQGQTWDTIMNGITAGQINRLDRYSVNDNTTIYASTDKGIFKTENRGGLWEPINNDISDKECYTVARYNSILLAGGYGEIYRSEDEGQTWELIPIGVGIERIPVIYTGTNPFVLVGYAISPNDDDIICKSEDEGETWSESAWSCNKIYDLVKFADIHFAATYPTLYESSDGCETWEAKFHGLGAGYPIPSLQDFQHYLFLTSWSGIYVLHADSVVFENVSANIAQADMFESLDVNQSLTVVSGHINEKELWVRPTLEMIDINAPETIYVDQSNNSGIENGTEDHPYNTLEEGMDAAAAGQTLFIKNGDYNPNGGTLYLKPGIKLEGESKEGSVINANLNDTTYSNLPVGINNLTFGNFNFGRKMMISEDILDKSYISNCICENIWISHGGGYINDTTVGPIHYFEITDNQVEQEIAFKHGDGKIVGKNIVSGNKANAIGLSNGFVQMTDDPFTHEIGYLFETMKLPVNLVLLKEVVLV